MIYICQNTWKTWKDSCKQQTCTMQRVRTKITEHSKLHGKLLTKCIIKRSLTFSLILKYKRVSGRAQKDNENAYTEIQVMQLSEKLFTSDDVAFRWQHYLARKLIHEEHNQLTITILIPNATAHKSNAHVTQLILLGICLLFQTTKHGR